MSILSELGGQGVLPSALNRQPEIDGQRLQAKKTLFQLQPRVSQMTLVVTSMLFNCGGAMSNSDAAVCTQTNCYKLAEQQIPHQACRSPPVKRDTGNATIHRNGTKPRSFFWKRGSHCNALCLVRFHRATAENEEMLRNLQKCKCQMSR